MIYLAYLYFPDWLELSFWWSHLKKCNFWMIICLILWGSLKEGRSRKMQKDLALDIEQ